VSGGLTWAMVALGIGVVVFRRRSVAVALVTAQALLLALASLHEASSANDAVASVALGVRGIALAVFFWLLVHRTRETRPVRAGIEPLARGGAAIGLALALIWLIPDLGLSSAASERAALTLVAIGLVTAATRRATLFQVLGIVLVENGLAVAALALPGSSSLAIEIGITIDLLLIAGVAGVFHERIFAEFGAGDSAALGSLRG
jgi:hydrogenase-4 component E